MEPRPGSHAAARLLLAVGLLAVLGPVVLTGKVLFAHDNAPFLGLASDPADPVSNYKFADQSHVYLPQIRHQIDGRSEGWIATWDPHTELGRPAWHSSGLSRSFVVFHVLSRLFDDPFRLYTALAVVATCLAGLFGYLFLQALGLRPAACLTGALGLSLGIFPAYWLSFVMFLWGIAWTLGCLWLVTLLLERPTLPRLLGLAFCVHAQLLSGYPQETVWHGYVVVGYVALRLLRDHASWAPRLRRLAWLGGALALALVSVLPTFLELGLALARSGRASSDPSFFLRVLPTIASAADLARFGTLVHDAFWLGNPIVPDPAYPRFNGVSLGPVAAGLLGLVLVNGVWRRTWPALVLVALTALATLVPAVYEAGVRFAGLSISRYIPLAGAWIPLIVVAALAADAHLRAGRDRRAAAAGVALLAPLGAGLCVLVAGDAVDGARLALSLLFSGGVLLFALLPRAGILSALALAGGFATARPLLLARPRDAIATDSPLVELVRANTREGERFAWVLPRVPGRPADPGLLPPNQEGLLELASVHAYDSLSSREYQAWVLRLSAEGTFEEGRYFKALSGTERLDPDQLALAGIGLLLTPLELDPDRFEPVPSPLGGLRAYRPRGAPRLLAQVALADGAEPTAERLLDPARDLEVRRTSLRDDVQRFATSSVPHPSVLFLSQQHHPRWRARAGDVELETVRLDGFYQGVRLPPGTSEVELRYVSPVRWSHLPQLAFLLAGLALALPALRKKLTA